jgi:peptidoglycan hydrolase CwlO-like protein
MTSEKLGFGRQNHELAHWAGILVLIILLIILTVFLLVNFNVIKGERQATTLEITFRPIYVKPDGKPIIMLSKPDQFFIDSTIQDYRNLIKTVQAEMKRVEDINDKRSELLGWAIGLIFAAFSIAITLNLINSTTAARDKVSEALNELEDKLKDANKELGNLQNATKEATSALETANQLNADLNAKLNSQQLKLAKTTENP